MSLGKYTEYKMLDATWVGAIPMHWAAKRVGVLFTERREKVNDRDYLPLSVTKSGVVPQLETAAKTDDGDNRKKVCVGDFVINSRSDRKGSSGKSDRDGSVSLIYTVIYPTDDISIDYSHYLLRSVPFQEEYYKFGKGIVADLWSTNYSDMKNIVLPLPPLSEQAAIATFLDRETAKIDALVNEQERLIELLKEKRQAVISHAVTKGLDPNVKMKPSGVEWLGDVPEHWEVLKIKRVAKVFVPQRNKPQLNREEIGVPWITMENLGETNLRAITRYVSNEEASMAGSRYLPKGSVVASCVGNFGIASINDDEVIINQQLQAFIPSEETLPKFIRYLVESGKQYFQQVGTAATLIYVNQIGFENFPIGLPDLKEQTQIICYLDEFVEHVDQLAAEIHHAIELLQEQHSALISAAVTGKIDVRELMSDQQVAAE